jgi:hypothetical protein
VAAHSPFVLTTNDRLHHWSTGCVERQRGECGFARSPYHRTVDGHLLV